MDAATPPLTSFPTPQRDGFTLSSVLVLLVSENRPQFPAKADLKDHVEKPRVFECLVQSIRTEEHMG